VSRIRVCYHTSYHRTATEDTILNMVDRTDMYKYPHQLSIKQLVSSTHKSFDFVLGLQLLPNQILSISNSVLAHITILDHVIYYLTRPLWPNHLSTKIMIELAPPSNTAMSIHTQASTPLVPPLNFAMVAPGVYRSGHPNRQNFPFLRKLGLKTVM
jgi:hypothetical protein